MRPTTRHDSRKQLAQPALYDMADGARAIGFIGLGAMGYPMAFNLATKLPNTTLYANDVYPDHIKRLLATAPS